MFICLMYICLSVSLAVSVSVSDSVSVRPSRYLFLSLSLFSFSPSLLLSLLLSLSLSLFLSLCLTHSLFLSLSLSHSHSLPVRVPVFSVSHAGSPSIAYVAEDTIYCISLYFLTARKQIFQNYVLLCVFLYNLNSLHPLLIHYNNNTSFQMFAKGERVRVEADLSRASRLQEGHGGWNTEMKKVTV